MLCCLWEADGFYDAESFPVQKLGMGASRAVAGGCLCRCLLLAGRAVPVRSGAGACLGACPGECEPTFAVTKVTEEVRACLSSRPHGRSDSCHCRFDLALSLQLRKKVVFPRTACSPRTPPCRLPAADGQGLPCLGSYPSPFSVPKAPQ